VRDLSLKGRGLVGVWLDAALKSQFALSYGCVGFLSVFCVLEIICTVSGVARLCVARDG